MPQDDHPYRSVLYMPGSRPRALEKARTLPADALILDLEDAVAPAEKPRARELVAEAVRGGRLRAAQAAGPRQRRSTPNGARRIWRAACAAGPDAILLPKVETPADVQRGGGADAAARRAGDCADLGDDGDAARRC